jgi:hypothetical protein
MDRAISNAIGHSLDFDARLAEIEQQAQAEVTRLEVIDALGSVYAIQRLHNLQFDDNGVLNQHISRIFADNDIVVPDRDPMLLCHAETCLTQLMSKRILVNLLEKAGPERIHNIERASDYALGYSVQGNFTLVHLRIPILPPDADRKSLPNG